MESFKDAIRTGWIDVIGTDATSSVDNAISEAEVASARSRE